MNVHHQFSYKPSRYCFLYLFYYLQVTHVLAGDEAGPAKVAKAQEFGIPILNENDFLELIINKSNKQKSDDFTKKEKNQNYQKNNDKSFNQKPRKDRENSSNRKSNNDHENSLCQKSFTNSSTTSNLKASRSKSDINHIQCPREKIKSNHNRNTETIVSNDNKIDVKENNLESVSKLYASTRKDLNGK